MTQTAERRPSTTAGAGRRGVVGLLGSVVAAVAGFALTFEVSRGLGGSSPTGVYFSAVAAASILLSVTKLGSDTGLVWALSRLSALDRHDERAAVLRSARRTVATASAGTGALLAAVAPWVAPVVSPDQGEAMVQALRVAGVAVALGAPLMLEAAALRGFGSVTTFTVVQNIALPLLRLVGVGVAVLLGQGVVGAVAGWVVPLILMVPVAVLLVTRQQRAQAGPARVPPAGRGGDAVREFWVFSRARWMAAQLEVVVVWADVLIVSALTSSAAAGVYAAASRFITSGTLVESAMRTAMAPQFSAALATGDVEGAQRLHALASRWIVLLSWPLYLTLACFSPFVLSLVGPEFVTGADALTLLGVVMAGVLAGGTSQTVLLMSGLSSQQAKAKTVTMVVNVVLNLALVPSFGFMGASVAWCTTMVLDLALALYLITRHTGVRFPAREVGQAALVAGLTFAVPESLARWYWGSGPVTVAGTLALCLVLYAVALVVWRRPLGLGAIERFLPAAIARRT